MYEKFEALLKKYGVTAYRVSKETGVTTATLTSWKQGKYTPKREKLQKIADYFGVTVEYFTGEEKKEDSHVLTAKRHCKRHGKHPEQIIKRFRRSSLL